MKSSSFRFRIILLLVLAAFAVVSASLDLFEYIFRDQIYKLSACDSIELNNLKYFSNKLISYNPENFSFIQRTMLTKLLETYKADYNILAKFECKNISAETWFRTLYDYNYKLNDKSLAFAVSQKIQLQFKNLRIRLLDLKKALLKSIQIETAYHEDRRKICNLKHQNDEIQQYLKIGNVCRSPSSNLKKKCSPINIKQNLIKNKLNLEINYSLFKIKWNNLIEHPELENLCHDL